MQYKDDFIGNLSEQAQIEVPFTVTKIQVKSQGLMEIPSNNKD